MKRLLSILSAILFLALGLGDSTAQPPEKLPKPDWVKMVAQGDHNPRLKGYLTPEGVKVEIVADFPTLVNPVGMTFGPDGALYVLEWPSSKTAKVYESVVELTYKDGSKRKFLTLKRPGKDKVKILLDSKGNDGIYDEFKLILEEEMLSSVLLVQDGYLYSSSQGVVHRYKQTKPEGPYGKKEIVAQGFGGLPYSVTGLSTGNTGWLYIACGSGDNFVEGSDGSRVNLLRTGGVFRCKPDGSKIHLYAQGLCHPGGSVTFDSFGNAFLVDRGYGTGEKSTGSRLLHVAEEADFGWRTLTGSKGKPDAKRSALFGELPGKTAPLLKTGQGLPGGILIFQDTFFPKEFQGLLYVPDPKRKSIRAFQVQPKGATFEVTHEFDLLKSDDPLFRPCQIILGPDGAMYLCSGTQDWTLESKHERIYRISWGGSKDQPALPLRGLDSWAKIAKQSDEELFKTLGSENNSDRQKAQQELARRGDKNRKKLLKVLMDEDQSVHTRIAALGTLHSMWNKEVTEAFQKLLGHPESELRRLAAAGLGLNAAKGDQQAHDNLVQALDDGNPAVKRVLALAIGKIGAKGAADSLINLLKFDESKDVYLRDGIVRAVERLGKPGIDALISLANSGVEKDLELAVGVFATLRSPAAAEALPELLKNYHLDTKQKVLLIESYHNYLFDPPVSVEPLVAYLQAVLSESKKLVEKSKGLKPEQIKPKLAALKQLQLTCLGVLASANGLSSQNAQKTILDILQVKTTMPGMPGQDRAFQKEVLAVLGNHPAGAKLAGQLYLDQKLPGDLRPQIVEILRPHAENDPELGKMLTDIMKKG